MTRHRTAAREAMAFVAVLVIVMTSLPCCKGEIKGLTISHLSLCQERKTSKKLVGHDAK